MAFPNPFYRWRPHPWHGLEVGPNPPSIVHAFIEITPFDQVKYESDKTTGYLRVDRPQRTSSLPPSLYGFVPRTYCAERVGALSSSSRKGDGDPLDICVLSEKVITHGDVILEAIPIGGLRMIDGDEADDKIIAVLQNDAVYGKAEDIGDIPDILVERLRHYFATYKLIPGEESRVLIEQVYGCMRARKVIEASIEDYEVHFGK
jgi:inorganic pyrophosphatase